MILKKHKATAAVAIVVVVLLAVFGIDRVGGETWLSAAASGEAGWHADTHTFAPQSPSVLRAFLIPLIMVLAVVAVASLGAILKRFSNRESEDATPPTPGAAG